MHQPIGDIVGILADNLALRKSVMALSTRKATGWAKGLDIPRDGERILYTGNMYQLIPSIGAMQKQVGKVLDSWLVNTMWMGRLANKFINISCFMARTDPKKQDLYNRRLRNIAMLLQKANVEFGYLYENELYAGALVYDLGGDEVFKAHARRVYNVLKSRGVKSVITVDPHSTDMLRDVYPTVIDDYDLEVNSYIEVLADVDLPVCRKLEKTVAIHDSCVYARYLDMLDEPRKLLADAGATVEEPDQTGKLTQCCGGPIEALYPEKSRKFAEERLNQLKTTGCTEIIAMCPICLHNLENAAAGDGLTVRDISELLLEACTNP